MKRKENESKREKFIRLAEARTNRIIDTLYLLGNCSNTAVYEYSQGDIEKIFGVIEQEVRKARKRFATVESEKATKFTLR